MLKGTNHAPDEIVTTNMLPESYTVTVENVATVGVMAGCEPKYMPVLLGMVEAFSDDRFSSCGPLHLVLCLRSRRERSHSQRDRNELVRQRPRLGHGKQGERNDRPILEACGYMPGRLPKRGQRSLQHRQPRQVQLCLYGERGEEPLGALSRVGRLRARPERGDHHEWRVQPPLALPSRRSGEDSQEHGRLRAALRRPGHYGPERRTQGRIRWPIPKQAAQEFLWSHATRTAADFRRDPFFESLIEPSLRGKSQYGRANMWPAEYLDAPPETEVQVFPREDVRIIVVGGETNPFTQAWQFARPVSIVVDQWK